MDNLHHNVEYEILYQTKRLLSLFHNYNAHFRLQNAWPFSPTRNPDNRRRPTKTNLSRPNEDVVTTRLRLPLNHGRVYKIDACQDRSKWKGVVSARRTM